jgi:hypothetical protein
MLKCPVFELISPSHVNIFLNTNMTSLIILLNSRKTFGGYHTTLCATQMTALYRMKTQFILQIISGMATILFLY